MKTIEKILTVAKTGFVVISLTVLPATAATLNDAQAPRTLDEYQAPRSQDELQAPRGDEFQAPRADRLDEVQAPRG
jgi:hypothetical protein